MVTGLEDEETASFQFDEAEENNREGATTGEETIK